MNNDNKHNHGNIKNIDIAKEVRKNFLEYAMSVIVSRALPDLKDGLKPVHRRIIYAMNDLGITFDKPHKKSARIVGEVIGKYHPHGDTAVYETMVRMAQDFSYRYPLIDGHGNFGSIDGDSAAAMRYTEARLSKISNFLIKDIDMEITPFADNYDASEKEPLYLPGYFPNILVNGATGIAVGMATAIPPHNLREVINGINAYIDNSEITIDELIEKHIFGPDFPTGALMTNGYKMVQGYKTGKGSVIIRAKINVEIKNKNKNLIITEIPYQVNKSKIIEKIADLIKAKSIDGIQDIRDESNYEGIRVVIVLKKDVNEDVIISKLYKYTQLQTTFSINLLTLHNNIPVVLDLKSIIKKYVEYQINIIIKRSKFEKNKILKKCHILEGLNIALTDIEKTINIIRSTKITEEARNKLMNEYNIDLEQAKAILDMKLQRLVGIERDKIANEIAEILKRVEYLNLLINNDNEQKKVLKEQLLEINNKFGDDRRTELIADDSINIDDESLIPNVKSMIVLSKDGYIRRIDPEEFRVQNRGGRGIRVNSDNSDPIEIMKIGKMRDHVLFFSDSGKVFRTKMYKIKKSSRTSKGIPIINFLGSLDKNEKITTILSIKDDKDKFKYLTFVTKKGMIKRTSLSEFDRVNQNGKIAIKLKNNDSLVSVIKTTSNDDIFIANASGKVIRIREEIIRPSGRSAMGVRGLKVDDSDFVVGAVSAYKADAIATVSSKGRAKKSLIEAYRISNRNCKGVKVMKLNDKTGSFKSILAIRNTDLFLIISSDGNLIKTKVSKIPLLGRDTSGVKGIRLEENHIINAIDLQYNKNNEEEIDDTFEDIENE